MNLRKFLTFDVASSMNVYIFSSPINIFKIILQNIVITSNPFCHLQFFCHTSHSYSIYSISPAFRRCFKTRTSRANTTLTTDYFTCLRDKKNNYALNKRNNHFYSIDSKIFHTRQTIMYLIHSK